MNKQKKIVLIVSAIVVALAIVGGTIFFIVKKNSISENPANTESSLSDEIDMEDDSNAEEIFEEDSIEGNNGDEKTSEEIDEELNEILDNLDNMEFDASAKDNGSTITVTINGPEVDSTGESSTIIQKYNFKNDVLESVYVDCILSNEESAKEFYNLFKEEEMADFMSDITINGNVVSYNSIADYKELGAISKQELLNSLKDAGIEVN